MKDVLYQVLTKKKINIKYWDTSFGNYRNKEEIMEEEPIIFNNKEDLFNWFLDNKDGIIPEIRLIHYLNDFKGVSKVLKITSLNNDITNYYTKISTLTYKYVGNNNWTLDNIDIDNIYETFNNKKLIKK